MFSVASGRDSRHARIQGVLVEGQPRNADVLCHHCHHSLAAPATLAVTCATVLMSQGVFDNLTFKDGRPRALKIPVK